MNEVLYDLYLITGNQTYADTAHLFDKPCFLGELKVLLIVLRGSG